MDDPFVTVREIARELGVTEVSVRIWIREGRLPAIRAGRAYRVRRSDLDRMTAVNGDSERPRPIGPISLESESPLMAQVRIPGDER
jgi:excisionase family DNA binding protein